MPALQLKHRAIGHCTIWKQQDARVPCTWALCAGSVFVHCTQPRAEAKQPLNALDFVQHFLQHGSLTGSFGWFCQYVGRVAQGLSRYGAVSTQCAIAKACRWSAIFGHEPGNGDACSCVDHAGRPLMQRCRRCAQENVDRFDRRQPERCEQVRRPEGRNRHTIALSGRRMPMRR